MKEKKKHIQPRVLNHQFTEQVVKLFLVHLWPLKKINVFRITTDKCIINWSRVQILSYKFSPSACPVLAEPAVEVSTRFGLLCFRLYFRKGGQPVTNAGCQPTC